MPARTSSCRTAIATRSTRIRLAPRPSSTTTPTTFWYRKPATRLGNRVTVGERNIDPTQPLVRRGHDYRLLQPALVMDPNRNRSAVAFDALGMVVGTAMMGKPEDNPVPGDRLAATFRHGPDPRRNRPILREPEGPAGSHTAGQRHHPHHLRSDTLLARAQSAAEAPGLCRYACPRNTRQRTSASGRPEDSGQLLLLRWLRA